MDYIEIDEQELYRILDGEELVAAKTDGEVIDEKFRL